MTHQSVAPCSGKLFHTFAERSNEQLEAALATATACFEVWRATSFAERFLIVAKVTSLMRARRDKFARSITLEIGKLTGRAVLDRLEHRYVPSRVVLQFGGP